MHIPEVARAVAELARVVRPSGTLIVAEANMNSVEAVVLRGLKRVLNRERADVKVTEAGVEYWTVGGEEGLVTRQANIEWLVSSFESGGLRLTRRIAGQFSEAYTLVRPEPLKRLVHGFNRFWFQHIGQPGPAFGNILFLQKV